MMPEPGFQKPIPKLDPADDRKSYTSLFVRTACSRSATPPNWPCLALHHNQLWVFGAFSSPDRMRQFCHAAVLPTLLKVKRNQGLPVVSH